MRLPIPGPSDVLAAALTVRDGVSEAVDGVSAALDLVPRTALLVDRAAALLDRVEQVVDDAEATLVRAGRTVEEGGRSIASAADTLERAGGAVLSAEQMLERVGRTAEDAAALVETSSTVLVKADRAVAGATGVLDRTDALVSAVEPLSRRLMPLAQRFAEQLHPKEVDAAIELVDRMPVLLRHLDEDVLPMLQQLDKVGPDVHQILEVVQDLREAITGLPGIGMLMKRGERRDDEQEEPR
jgi:hypothetical protein